MGIELKAQAGDLALSLVLGITLGLLYDLLRDPRYAAGKLTAALLDIVFCLASGWGLFCIAMRSGNGILGIWELAFALAGFLLYLHFFSDTVLRLAGKLRSSLSAFTDERKKIKKAGKSLKRVFQKNNK